MTTIPNPEPPAKPPPPLDMSRSQWILNESTQRGRLGIDVVIPVQANPPRNTITSDEDARCLLQNHPALAWQVDNDLEGAKRYYKDKGFYEGMSGACPQTDEDAEMYVQAYEDLQAEWGNDRNRLAKARKHWLTYGWRQGRIGHARYKILMALDATGRAQKDAHRPYKESINEDPAVRIAKEKAEAKAEVMKEASAMNKVVHLRSVRTGKRCATDAQGMVVCAGEGVGGPGTQSEPEPFQLERVSPNTFVFRSNRTLRYCREDANDNRVRCNEPTATSASKFTYVPGDTFSRFRMMRVGGQACDHDARGLTCTFPPNAATNMGVPAGFDYDMTSTSIQTDNKEAIVQAAVEEVVEPRIHTSNAGERAFGTESWYDIVKDEIIVFAVITTALAVNLGGGLYMKKLWTGRRLA